MAFSFTVDGSSPQVAGGRRVSWGTWASSVGTDTGGTIVPNLEKTDFFSVTGDTNVGAPGATKAANGRDIVILHPAAVRNGTWTAWGT